MIWQQIANGIATGAVYALTTLGLTMVYGVLRVLHVAHAGVYTLGATYTWPDTTGEVGIFPAGCTGTADYADGAGNCDTINGVEDLETATNHGVIVGDGSVFATKALSDADAPRKQCTANSDCTGAYSGVCDTSSHCSVGIAGATLHYNTADQTFSASTIPTVDDWYPYGGDFSNPANEPAATDDDTCTCFRAQVLQAIADLDDVSFDLSTANTATNDYLEIGIYSEDGQTQYFECGLIALTDGALSTANTLECNAAATKNGKILQPGDYWICYGADATSGTMGYVLSGAEVGGGVEVHSAPGEGTQVVICVPLRKDEG